MLRDSARMVICVAGLAMAASVAPQAPTPVYLTVPGRTSANVWLAAEGARVAAAWGASRPGGGTDVYLAVSSDGGRTFSTPTRVNDREGTARVIGEAAPRVTFVARRGQSSAIDVLWVSRESATDIRLARSLDDGRTFGPSRTLQAKGAVGNRGWATLTSDVRGGTHALWLDHRGMAAPAGAPEHQHGAAGAEVLPAQGSALYYSDGTTEREITKGVCYCCKTAIAAGANGAIYAAWRHVYPGNRRDIAFTVSSDGGRTFLPPVRVSEDEWAIDGCPEDGPALGIDPDGTVYVVWPTVLTDPSPHKALFYSTTRDGRTFTPRVRVSPAGHSIAHPQIAIGPAGERAAFWEEIVGGRNRVFLSHRYDEGGFGPPEPLSELISGTYAMPVFAGGALVVAWTEGGAEDSHIVVRRISAR